ncbi:MAG: hypothetical protein IT384_17450 [Deltaproteobacteria bacterium]|nr:hypothetical protein [Deltaproteobacteria bacterium]
MSRIAVAVLLSVALSSPALGQSKPEEAAQEARMGAVHMKYARHLAALQAYTRAYELAPVPAYLLGIGEAHLRMQQFKEALAALERYQREAKDPKARAEGEPLLNEAKIALGIAVPRAAPPPRPPPPPPPKQEPEDEEEADSTPPPPVVVPARPAPKPAVAPPPAPPAPKPAVAPPPAPPAPKPAVAPPPAPPAPKPPVAPPPAPPAPKPAVAPPPPAATLEPAEDPVPATSELDATPEPSLPPAAPMADDGTATPIYARGWFWPVVIGVVAVAAGGTALALTTGGREILVPPAGSAGTIDWR